MSNQQSIASSLIGLMITMLIMVVFLPPTLRLMRIATEVQEEGSSTSPPPNPLAPFADAASHIVSIFVSALSVLVPVVLGLIALKLGLHGLRAIRDSPHSIWTVGVEGRPLDVEAVDLGEHDDAECLTCGRDDGPGVRRGYVEEFVLAGLPVWETDRSETYDCAAHTDRAGLEALGDEDEDRDGLDVALDTASESDEDEEHDEDIEETAVAGHPFASSHWKRSSVETDEDEDASEDAEVARDPRESLPWRSTETEEGGDAR